jgi:hypothetical protein
MATKNSATLVSDGEGVRRHLRGDTDVPVDMTPQHNIGAVGAAAVGNTGAMTLRFDPATKPTRSKSI